MSTPKTVAVGERVACGPGLPLAWILGLYFIIAGIAYLGLGIFSKGISGGARTLDIVLGLLFIVGGVVVLANPNEAAVFLGLFLGILIGILWIIEGIVALVQSGDASSRYTVTGSPSRR